ncbi:MAG: DUF4153 domain-containing protein [Candidatus Sericytochromatia bacterium]
MSDKTRLALGILVASVVLGFAGNWLLWAPDWGINVGLWLAIAVAAALGLRRLGRVERLPGEPWSFVAVLFFAFAFAWRDTGWLRTLDILVIGVALTLPFWRPVAGTLKRALLGEAALGAANGTASAIGGWVFALDPEIKWSEAAQGGAWRHGGGVLLGLALGLPLLLIFGALFMSADARFDGLVRGAFKMDLEEGIGHGFVIAILAWGTGGFLYGMLGHRARPAVSLPGWAIGIVPVATVLVMLVALFGTFVALQVPYLFGGAAVIAQSSGLTFAEYARRGFFELVTVTTLALPLLLALHGLKGAASARAEAVFRVLAWAMLLLLGVFIASAVQRMLLYQGEYGWTTARLFVLAFEFWLAGVLAWFGATVLRGNRPAFLFGAIAWGMVAAAAMHVPNWEAMIVRHNLSLATQGRPVDVQYFYELSLDAVPALAEALPTLKDDTGRAVAHQLYNAHLDTHEPDWRTWRWSQQAAAQALKDRRAELELLTKPVYGPEYVHGSTMYPVDTVNTVEPTAERDWRDSR